MCYMIFGVSSEFALCLVFLISFFSRQKYSNALEVLYSINSKRCGRITQKITGVPVPTARQEYQ